MYVGLHACRSCNIKYKAKLTNPTQNTTTKQKHKIQQQNKTQNTATKQNKIK